MRPGCALQARLKSLVDVVGEVGPLVLAAVGTPIGLALPFGGRGPPVAMVRWHLAAQAAGQCTGHPSRPRRLFVPPADLTMWRGRAGGPEKTLVRREHPHTGCGLSDAAFLPFLSPLIGDHDVIRRTPSTQKDGRSVSTAIPRERPMDRDKARAPQDGTSVGGHSLPADPVRRHGVDRPHDIK